MKKVFVVMLFALFLMPRVDAQVLKSYEEQSNKMGKYVLEVPDLKGEDFISGDMLPLIEKNGEVQWSKEEIYDSDGNGLVEFTYIGWNVLLKCYWTSPSLEWNKHMSKQPCYREVEKPDGSVEKLLYIGLVDGQVVQLEEFHSKFLGDYHDAFVGWEIAGDLAYVYFNYNTMTIVDPQMVPFVQLSSRGWKEREVTILNSWGWGYITEKLDHLYYQDEEGEKHYGDLQLGFGAYLPSGEKTWPKNVDNMKFRNEKGTIQLPIYQLTTEN